MERTPNVKCFIGLMGKLEAQIIDKALAKTTWEAGDRTQGPQRNKNEFRVTIFLLTSSVLTLAQRGEASRLPTVVVVS